MAERVPTMAELKGLARSLGVGGSISFVKAKNWNMGTDGVSIVLSRIGHGAGARIALAAALRALAKDKA